MTNEAVLGLDAGTTTAKAVVIGPAGEVLGTAESDPIPTLAPEPGAAEQEPDALGSALEQACRGVTSRLEDGTRIVAASLAAQSGSVVGIDADDRPMTRFVTWLDTRAEPTVAGWTDAECALIRNVSGWTPSTGLGLASVRWLRSTRPELESCRRWASVDDFLLHHLTGTWATNPSNAAGMQFMAVATGTWDRRLCRLAGIDPGRLSPIRATGQIGGRITPAAAQRTGLVGGTPVAIGGHDQTCAAFGLGAAEPGEIVLSAGTAWVVTAVTERPEVDRFPVDLNVSPHVVPGLWTASLNLGGLGAVLDWWRHQAHGPDPDPSLIERDLASAAPHGPIFIPAPSLAPGVDLGGFADIDSRPGPARVGRAERTRAVLEAATFEVRRALETMLGAGVTATHITFVGGGSRSPGLRRMLADTTGLPVTVPPDASWPGLGAAALAARAEGWSLPDVLSDRATSTEPSPTDALRSRFETYLQLVRGGPA
jgi:xylulokinase